jgi:hypothetical protein
LHNKNQIQAGALAERELRMYKFYIGLWWFSLIQWPLFSFLLFYDPRDLLNCGAKSFVCHLYVYFTAYMVFFAPYLILPVILTIILIIRKQRGISISKLEKRLAIGSWVLSLFVSIVLISQGGFHT